MSGKEIGGLQRAEVRGGVGEAESDTGWGPRASGRLSSAPAGPRDARRCSRGPRWLGRAAGCGGRCLPTCPGTSPVPTDEARRTASRIIAPTYQARSPRLQKDWRAPGPARARPPGARRAQVSGRTATGCPFGQAPAQRQGEPDQKAKERRDLLVFLYLNCFRAHVAPGVTCRLQHHRSHHMIQVLHHVMRRFGLTSVPNPHPCSQTDR